MSIILTPYLSDGTPRPRCPFCLRLAAIIRPHVTYRCKYHGQFNHLPPGSRLILDPTSRRRQPPPPNCPDCGGPRKWNGSPGSNKKYRGNRRQMWCDHCRCSRILNPVPARGSRIASSKLTPRQVLSILNEVDNLPRTQSGRLPYGTHKRLAKTHNISPHTIRQIISGRGWKWIHEARKQRKRQSPNPLL